MRSSILLILSLGLALASCGAPTSEDAAQVALNNKMEGQNFPKRKSGNFSCNK